MNFDWHDGKRDRTFAERGIDFAEVVMGFIDPNRLVARDDRVDYGKIRYNMLALVGGRLFHVTYTLRGPVTWIISARKANKREQKRYEQR